MRYLIFSLAAAIATIAATTSVSAQQSDAITGLYKVVGETTAAVSHVQIYRTGNTYEGRIVWLQTPNDENGNPYYDTLNPDPELRKVKADRIVILRDLAYDVKKKMWVNGTIYNPVTGKTYGAQASFDAPSKLKVRGYMGNTPMMGKNFFWEKIE